jgi:hypothetical protein
MRAAEPALGASELPGFAPDARLLIVNCDDFGMHDAVDAAVVESIENGTASAWSLMGPVPRGGEHDTAAPRTRTQPEALGVGFHHLESLVKRQRFSLGGWHLARLPAVRSALVGESRSPELPGLLR